MPVESFFDSFLVSTSATPQGWYLYVETSYPRVQGEVARISSPVIKVKAATDNCRLRMFYHMFGKDVNSLTISYRDSVGGKMSKIKTIIGKILYQVLLL